MKRTILLQKAAILTALQLILLVSPVYSLLPGAALSQYPREELTTASGLHSEFVHSVIQTKDGFIWLATPAGLVRYNGIQFQVFNKRTTPELTSNNIRALQEDPDGSLWIGTDGGLLNYKKNRFRSFTLNDGLSDDHITALARDSRGTLWIATRKEVNVLEKDGFSTTSISQPLSMFADSKLLLVGTTQGISIVTDGRIVNHPSEGGVTAVYRNRESKIWLAVQNKGLCILDGERITVVFPTVEKINAILEDRDKNLWLGTDRGLQRLDGAVLSSHPEIDVPVSSLLEDREGSLWVGTLGGGLHQLKSAPFVTFTGKEGMADERSWCVLQDPERNIWIGTNHGVSRWTNGKMSNYPVDGPVRTMTVDGKGALWIGAASGIMRWNGITFTMVIPGLTAKVILADEQENLWIGAQDGLRSFQNGKLSGPQGDEVTELFRDSKGTLLIGTRNGLKRLQDGNPEPFQIMDAVTSILEDHKGTLWIGTERGVHSIRNGQVTTFTTDQGLHDDTVHSMLEDADGNLWMNSSRGVFRVEQRKGSLVSTTYGKRKGLNSNEAASGKPAGWKASDGTLWFAMTRGTGMTHPGRVFKEQAAPPVVIESVLANRIPMKTVNDEETIRLPSGTTRVEFQYFGISFLGGIQYRYVLQGYDQFWTNAGNQRIAIYRNLPPGKYRFKLVASNNDGVWNTDGATVSIEIPSGGINFNWVAVVVPALTGLLGFGTGWLMAVRRRRGRPDQNNV